MRTVIAIVTVISPLLLVRVGYTADPVYDPNTATVSNWTQQALWSLNIRTEKGTTRPIRQTDLMRFAKKLRCIKLNNYWCIKDVGWIGGIGKDRGSHTAFSYPRYSARAVARDLRTKYLDRGLTTAWQIMSRYADPDSCVGDIVNPDGSCKYGKNPTKKYATYVIRGVAGSVNSDLSLFDKSGLPTSQLIRFILNMSEFEIAPFSPDKDLIRRGVEIIND